MVLPTLIDDPGQQIATHEPPLRVSGSGARAHRTLDSLPEPASGDGRSAQTFIEMTMLRSRIAFRGWFVALALLVAGCASSRAKIVSPQQLPLYGSDSLYHTVYVGSDDRHHHFMWSRGLRRGEYLVDRSALHLSREFPRGAGHAFLSRTPDGSVDVLTLAPRKGEQNGAANGSQPLSPDSRARPGEAGPRR
jgi:hypothetical protein